MKYHCSKCGYTGNGRGKVKRRGVPSCCHHMMQKVPNKVAIQLKKVRDGKD